MFKLFRNRSKDLKGEEEQWDRQGILITETKKQDTEQKGFFLLGEFARGS